MRQYARVGYGPRHIPARAACLDSIRPRVHRPVAESRTRRNSDQALSFCLQLLSRGCETGDRRIVCEVAEATAVSNLIPALPWFKLVVAIEVLNRLGCHRNRPTRKRMSWPGFFRHDGLPID